MRELSSEEFETVSSGEVTAAQVLGAGAAITGLGAAALVAAPELGAAAAVYGATSAVMTFGSAMASLVE